MVKNVTQFTILLHENYFDSGRYELARGTASPFTQTAFSCCNVDSSVLTGVTGGTAFKIILDDSHTFDFALVRPNIAPVRSSDPLRNQGGLTFGRDGRPLHWTVQSRRGRVQVCPGRIPERDRNWKILDLSKNKYECQDEDDKPVKIEFQVSAAPG